MEETYNEESLLRPITLANVSGLDPSEDKSTLAYQTWNAYRETSRGATATPNEGDQDEETDESTPRVKVKIRQNDDYHFFALVAFQDESCNSYFVCTV